MEEPQEVVRLIIEVMNEGTVFCQEFSFCSDNQVFSRTTNFNSQESPGWKKVENHGMAPEQLSRLVRKMEAKGWTAIWNPKHQPAGQEYIRTVTFQ